MTYPNMKPCPKCGSPDVSLYTYESGWSRVECNACHEIHSCEGTKLRAIREHNRRCEPCPYCTGKFTGLPGNACENCMNTGLAHPTAADLA